MWGKSCNKIYISNASKKNVWFEGLGECVSTYLGCVCVCGVCVSKQLNSPITYCIFSDSFVKVYTFVCFFSCLFFLKSFFNYVMFFLVFLPLPLCFNGQPADQSSSPSPPAFATSDYCRYVGVGSASPRLPFDMARFSSPTIYLPKRHCRPRPAAAVSSRAPNVFYSSAHWWRHPARRWRKLRATFFDNNEQGKQKRRKFPN